jgi:PPOX class probable F420-dependent enzyme
LAFEALAGHKYVSITSYRRDGRPVSTPVWFVLDGGEVCIWTVATSGKVKRMKRNPMVMVAPCTARGRPLGEGRKGTAALLPDDRDPALRSKFGSKYGLPYRLDRWASRVLGKKRIFVRIGPLEREDVRHGTDLRSPT